METVFIIYFKEDGEVFRLLWGARGGIYFAGWDVPCTQILKNVTRMTHWTFGEPPGGG
jgi:hypothetical protein